MTSVGKHSYSRLLDLSNISNSKVFIDVAELHAGYSTAGLILTQKILFTIYSDQTTFSGDMKVHTLVLVVINKYTEK